MKSYVLGLLLVGVCLTNAFDLTGGLNFNRKLDLSIPKIEGGPKLNVDVSGSAGDSSTFQDSIKQSMANLRNSINQLAGNALLAATSRLRQALNIPDDTFKAYVSSIPGLKGLFDGSSGFSIPTSFGDLLQPKIPGISSAGLPQLPGIPKLGDIPSSPFGAIPKIGIPQLPGLPGQGSGSPFGNIPGIPSIPDISNGIPKISLPGLPNMPDVNAMASALNSPDIKQLLGLPDVSSLSNSLSNGTVESALDNLQSISDQAAKQANASTAHALSGLQAYGKTLSQEIDNVSKSAQAQINKTMDGLSSDIRDCVNEKGNPARAGVDAAKKSAQECVQNKIDEAKGIVEGAQKDVKAAQLGVDYVRGNLSNCNLNVSMSLTSLPTYNASSPACIASALLSIQSETLLLPVNMASRAANAVSLVQGLQGYAMKCMATLMGDIAKSTMSTTLAVGKCYADKH